MPATPPLQIVANYNVGAVAPHGATTRWTYTVPAGRQAVLEALSSTLERDTATVFPGQATLVIRTTLVSAAFMNNLSLAIDDGNFPLRALVETWGGAERLLAGDSVLCFTQDASGGGTLYYQAGAKAIEYDV